MAIDFYLLIIFYKYVLHKFIDMFAQGHKNDFFICIRENIPAFMKTGEFALELFRGGWFLRWEPASKISHHANNLVDERKNNDAEVDHINAVIWRLIMTNRKSELECEAKI